MNCKVRQLEPASEPYRHIFLRIFEVWSYISLEPGGEPFPETPSVAKVKQRYLKIFSGGVSLKCRKLA